jgi:hypothetical protein
MLGSAPKSGRARCSDDEVVLRSGADKGPRLQRGGTFCLDRSSPFNWNAMEVVMGFGRGALLWLIGVPIPIIILLALFMHH